jgi:ABC-type Mn2+/Zn2+ transport system ATPase subunit
LLLAGALAAEPQVLVLDEPTDGLDVKSQGVLIDLLQSEKSAGLCTVVISHELQDLLALSDQIAWVSLPDDTGEPSHVELIAPNELADRALHRK